jgi:hypothetical protein
MRSKETIDWCREIPTLAAKHNYSPPVPVLLQRQGNELLLLARRHLHRLRLRHRCSTRLTTSFRTKLARTALLESRWGQRDTLRDDPLR